MTGSHHQGSGTRDAARGRTLLNLTLHPNRSLSRRGFRILMAAFTLAALAVGAAFTMVGAWPVIGFCGLEALLLYLALTWSYRTGRRFEEVRLTDTRLTVDKVDHWGKRETFEFQPGWLRVLMDDPPRHESQLRLTSHGETVVLGAFLAPRERLEVANEIRRALDAYSRAAPA